MGRHDVNVFFENGLRVDGEGGTSVEAGQVFNGVEIEVIVEIIHRSGNFAWVFCLGFSYRNFSLEKSSLIQKFCYRKTSKVVDAEDTAVADTAALPDVSNNVAPTSVKRNIEAI